MDELNLRDNTIICLWGDHGWHLGDHGLWGKSTNFEQATRSPMLISAPGISSNRTHQPTGFIDIYPTLCDLAGLPIPEILSGHSLKEIMTNQRDDNHAVAISQFQRGNKMGYAVRDNRYRYVEWIDEGLHVNPHSNLDKVVDRQLFDYQKDPMEKVNIAGKTAYRKVQKKLADYLQKHKEKILKDPSQ